MRNIKKDTLVYVRQKVSDPWLPRYFSHYHKLNFLNHEFRCFEDGKMSHETNATLPWLLQSEFDPSLYKEGEIVIKGWEVVTSDIQESYHFGDINCTAHTRGEAKSKFMKMGEVEGMMTIYNDEITFLNIPIRRCKAIDKVIYKGNIIRRNRIPEIIEVEKRREELKYIMDNETISHCYIRKRGEYYRSGFSGYTSLKECAGVYTKKEAVDHVGVSLDIFIIPIDIQEHNNYLQERINSIKEKLILC